ncbi:hypothetical protein BD769DRAFT_1510170 [Suillus cothurnatus]|nr:hypothetical protein BD769DRAFT_1510170 [Suillus cothurnatus]
MRWTSCEQWDMPKVVTWTTSPHLRSGKHKWLGISLLAYCHHQNISASAREKINTLTACRGTRDGFGQRGSSSTEHQHTHILSRDQGRVQSARLELDKASTHSLSVKGSRTGSGSGMGSVSEARARQSINTLTPCQGIRDGFVRGNHLPKSSMI